MLQTNDINKNKKTDSRTLTAGGILTALSVLFVMAAAYSPTANMAIFALASLCTAIAVVRFGNKTAAVIILATSLLAAVWPGIVLAIPYYCLFGPYPIVKALIEKRKMKILPSIAAKLAAASVMSFLAIALTMWLTGLQFDEISLFPIAGSFSVELLWIAALLIMEAALLVYDFGLTLLITMYMKRLHDRF